MQWVDLADNSANWVATGHNLWWETNTDPATPESIVRVIVEDFAPACPPQDSHSHADSRKS
jgi:hypothetical protein